jgi:endonuclease I
VILEKIDECDSEVKAPPRFITAFKACCIIAITVLLFVPAVYSQIPAGYYSTAAGKTGQTLQVALYNIIKGHNVLNYTPGVWNAFYSTDLKSNGKIWDMYSDVPGGVPPYDFFPGSDQCGVGGGGMEGDCYSREHSFPKSWFDDQAPMNTDLFHIFPADQYVNNMHSNFPFAVVGTATAVSLNGSKKGSCATTGYTGTVFEPIDAYKGDFARAYFYMATRYQNVIATWPAYDPMAEAVLDGTSYPAFKTWYLNMLIAWHNQDPVSAKEVARNDSVYKLQLNRNPFIDHPEYVASVWQPSGPKDEPTNHAANFIATTGYPPYSVAQFTWTDATGTVIPDGYLIRGSTTGYTNISVPVDGIPVPDGGMDKNTGPGIQSAQITGLPANAICYFRIFPFTNSGNQINYKTNGVVPSDTVKTSQGISVLQTGDIAIIEVSSTDPDKVSFITFRSLNAYTVINFTDNGFISPTAVRTGEGFLTYTAPSVIPAGTVVSWYRDMNVAGTGWSVPTSQFQLATAGDQVFAYQGEWGNGMTLIHGVQNGNTAWLTSGTATANTSYQPAALTQYLQCFTFPERNGYYNLIAQGTIRALQSLTGYPDNWTRSATWMATPVWSFSLTGHTTIHVPAIVSDFTIGADETLSILPGVQFQVTGNITLLP